MKLPVSSSSRCRALSFAACCAALGCSSSTAKQTDSLTVPWDWTGIIGTGQSLSTGGLGTPVIATTQPYNNQKLVLGGATVPPFDPTIASLQLAPLTEPLRNFATQYPSAYPDNLNGETPHTAMANQITALVMAAASRDYVVIPSVVGESGQPLTVIKKSPTNLPMGGTSGRAYDASLFEAAAIKRLADAAGKSYGIGAVVLTHGEADAGNTSYANDIYQFLGDYNADLPALTGQAATAKIPMLVSQQNSVPSDARTISTSAVQVWKAGVDHPGEIVCTGPKYQYSYANDSTHVHMSAHEYERVGEKYGQVYFERVVLGHDWQPLQPTSATVSGNVITVKFHVPVPPLTWDGNLPPPHGTAIPEWAAGRGFEVSGAGVAKMITGVEIVGEDSVAITVANDLSGLSVLVGYAATAEGGMPPADQPARWGHLRDSDPFVGAVTGLAQPNYCVAFQLTAQ